MIVLTKTEEIYPDGNVPNEAKYVLPDNYTVELLADCIKITPYTDHLERYDIIADMSNENATIYKGIINVPNDLRGNNYCFDGINWTANPKFQQ